MPDDATLLGVVAVIEYVDADGVRQLTRVSGDGTESWQASGYLHEALNGRLAK